MLIKPLNCLAMLITSLLDNPYYHICVFTRSICDNFSKMVMICIF